MELNYLKTFSEVVQAGSFTLAAQQLHLSQPTVTRRVKMIEEQFNCQLLTRCNDTIKLTPEGDLLYKKALKILELQEDLCIELNIFKPKKEVLFACTPTFGMVHLPKILMNFIQAQADLSSLKFLFINPDEIIKNLVKGFYELAVVEHCLDYDLSSFKTVLLSKDEMVFAVSCDYVQKGNNVDIDTLFSFPLYIRGDGCCARKLLEKNLQKVGRDFSDFQQVIVCDDLHIIQEALLNGRGVAFLARELLQPQFDLNQLKKFKINGFNHEFQRTLVLSEALSEREVTSNFVKQILDYFKVEQEPPILQNSISSVT